MVCVYTLELPQQKPNIATACVVTYTVQYTMLKLEMVHILQGTWIHFPSIPSITELIWNVYMDCDSSLLTKHQIRLKVTIMR